MDQDLPLVARELHDHQNNALIVDHYGATPSYLHRLRELTPTLGIIDDLADRDLTAADWVLNQNLGAEELVYLTNPNCRRALGTPYCLLRPQFAEARRQLKRRFLEPDNHVLITLGGGATIPTVVEILAALETIPRKLALRVIIAGQAKTTRVSLGSARHSLEILHNVTNMAEHMAWADLSINAGGSTTWELCTLGVPMIVVPLSHDQVANATRLEEIGCARRVVPERIADALATVVADCFESPERRRSMSRTGQQLVDGEGAATSRAVLGRGLSALRMES